MVARAILTCALGSLLLAAPMASAQNMKVELNRVDFETYLNELGTQQVKPNTGEAFGWGLARYSNSEAYSGQWCAKYGGINMGYGTVLLADPVTEANTLYQAEWMVKNGGTLSGRAKIEYVHGSSGGTGTGAVSRTWPSNIWVKDSISWTTLGGVGTENALLIYIACQDNQGNHLGVEPFYLYIDDLVMYKIAQRAPAPPRIGYFGREADGQPVSTTVNAGETAVFNVLAAGLAPLSYQWKRNGVNIEGATSRTLRISNAGAADNGAKYSCVVTNADGEVTSSEATLTVSDGATASTSRSARAAARGVRAVARGSTAIVALPASGAWTVELGTLQARLVHTVTGSGSVATMALPNTSVVYIARITCAAQAYTTTIYGNR